MLCITLSGMLAALLKRAFACAAANSDGSFSWTEPCLVYVSAHAALSFSRTRATASFVTDFYSVLHPWMPEHLEMRECQQRLAVCCAGMMNHTRLAGRPGGDRPFPQPVCRASPCCTAASQLAGQHVVPRHLVRTLEAHLPASHARQLRKAKCFCLNLHVMLSRNGWCCASCSSVHLIPQLLLTLAQQIHLKTSHLFMFAVCLPALHVSWNAVALGSCSVYAHYCALFHPFTFGAAGAHVQLQPRQGVLAGRVAGG